MQTKALSILSGFISKLLTGYSQLEGQHPGQLSLILAQGLLLRQSAALEGCHLGHQTLVLGPTQAGKSTLVNLLLGGNHATASPLAGFTRHAQGFGPSLAPEHKALLHQLLPGFTQVERSALDPNAFNYYSLSELDNPATRPNSLLWDSPDFDSVNAAQYKFSLPAFCALADLLILVVSKEKYADQSVWEMLHLLMATNIPLGLVINKVPEQEAQEFETIIARRFASEQLPCPAIFTLPWQSPADPIRLAASPQGQRLVQWHTSSGQISLTPMGLADFVQQHWPLWTLEVRLELACQTRWQAQIERLGLELVEHFQRDYLQNQTYQETRARVLVELLQLLELPGMGKALTGLRQVLTFPVRTLGTWLDRITEAPKEAAKAQDQNAEQSILTNAIRQLLQQLMAQAAAEASQQQGREGNWWRHLWQHLTNEEPALTQMARQQILQHQTGFVPQIKATADALQQRLSQDPVRLHSLRAARLTTDAAAIAIPFATGTTGWLDLALSPVMLAFSSLLTEGALGQYLSSQMEQLKDQQLASVQTKVLNPMQQVLLELIQEIPAKYALGLSARELEEAENALEALK